MASLDLDSIRSFYSSLSDGELINRISLNSSGLKSEVLIVIKDELVKRDLSLRYLDATIAQNKVLTDSELSVYAESIRNLDCPVCKKKTTKLNASIIHSIVSVLVFSTTTKEIVIACPTCLDKRNSDATNTTLVLGWWSLGGFFQTPSYISNNMRLKKEHHQYKANNTLITFIKENIGRLELYKDDDLLMSEFIATPHKVTNN